MVTGLAEATQAWLGCLERQESRAALDCFCSRIIPCLIEGLRAEFCAEYPELPNRWRYEGLITLLGFTPDTSILATRFTGAERVAILHTPETAAFLGEVRAFCGLPAGCVVAVPLDRRSLLDVSRALQEAVAALGSPRAIAVEVTGGTKPMSTALHVAAALSDMDTLYIDYTRYDPRYRKPMPDSIHMRLLESPLRSGSGDGAAGAALDDVARRMRLVTVALEELSRDLQRDGASLEDVRGRLTSAAADACELQQGLEALTGASRMLRVHAPGRPAAS